MSKYIDLYEEITETRHTTVDYRRGVVCALDFLDRNPAQVPGRTITESEFDELVDTLHQNWAAPEDFSGVLSDELESFGITIIPNPVPTNAEKLAAHLLDLLGVVEAIGNTGVHNMAYELDRAGVKAPDHD